MNIRQHYRTVLAVAAAALVTSGALAPRAAGQGQAARSGGSEVTWSLAAVGDSIITRRLSGLDDRPFLDMVRLIREADVAFNNLEITLFRFSEFTGYPQAQSGGTWLHGPPEGAEDLKWMGFDLYNRANNHTTDFGVEGMIETTRILDGLELVHAGVGMTLSDASQAAYLDTGKGRIALIGLATTFTPMSRAADPRAGMPGRPGLNPLRVDRRYQLDEGRMADLRRVVTALRGRVPERADEPVRFAGTTFVRGPENNVIEEVNRRDEDRILRSVRSASRQADFVIVNSHSHEPGNEALEPPPFMTELARKCIDAGADAFIVHGPHQLRGIEVYKGKPIFYSLGNFIFQNDTAEPQPADFYESLNLGPEALPGDLFDARSRNDTIGFPANSAYWESVVALPVFRGDQLAELKLYPIDLGHKTPRPQRGTPRLAGAELARKIIDRVSKLSAPFGTRIVFQDGIGVWQPGSGAPSGPEGRP